MFSEFLNPSKNKRKKYENEQILIKLQWILKEECEEKFDFDFINECFSNILVKYYGLIGSAQYKIRIKSIDDGDNTAEIALNYKELDGFWGAMNLASNRFGTDGLVEFKIKLVDISFIKENENGGNYE